MVAKLRDQHFASAVEVLLQSQSARAPAYAYVFDWRTPDMDGLLRSPHGAEVGFIFGSMPPSRGPHVEEMSRVMIATWSAFAHRGDPNNPTVPHWARFDPRGRATMTLNVESHSERDPGGEARASLDGLPPYEYSMPVNFADGWIQD